MSQVNLIVKEEGICIYREPEEPKDYCSGDGDIVLVCEDTFCRCQAMFKKWRNEVKQAQDSAILCEDQAQARRLILKHHFPLSGHILAPAINTPYPVPGIEFEEFLINTKFPELPSPENIKKVARIIEHPEEKGIIGGNGLVSPPAETQ